MGQFDSKLKNQKRILLEFVNEEANIGLKDTSCYDIIEKVLSETNKVHINSSDLINCFKQLNFSSVIYRDYISQDFFFTDNLRTKYDFKKVITFIILYAGGAH